MSEVVGETLTYCRLCEATCGLVATVAEDKIIAVRPDKDHVLSQGYFCVKSQAMVEITNDPDRILTPLRRTGGPGDFEQCSWDEALSDIASRLGRIRDRHGPEAIALSTGNPNFFNMSAGLGIGRFMEAVGTKLHYNINSEDGATRYVASHFLYNNITAIGRPDLWHTSFAVLIGTNPLVAKGSLFGEPRVKEALDSIVARGGRVLVIDPRRTETARHYEHLYVRPASDGWLLAALARVILEENLADDDFLGQHCTGRNALEDALAAFDVAECAQHCDVPEQTIRQLARDLASAPSSFIFGRTGTCTQRFGTLINILQDVVTALCGNIDKQGGLMGGWSPFGHGQDGVGAYGRWSSRIDKLPECAGLLPSHALVNDIREPGDERVRGVINIASNSVISAGAGAGDRMREALEHLDLFVSIDLYVTETNRHADYVLPATTMYEREDFPLALQGNYLRPAVWATPAMTPPRGAARTEWSILTELTARMGLSEPASGCAEVTPRTIVDDMLSTSTIAGMTMGELIEKHPHGLSCRPGLSEGDFLCQVSTDDGRINLAHGEMLRELQDLRTHADPPSLPMRLIGMRELQSMNSWMHNSERLMPGRRRFGARISKEDAHSLGITDGDAVRIRSAAGSIDTVAILTDDVRAGTVALPHGWGHVNNAGWKRANLAEGACSNDLASYRIEDIERLAGMSILNGIPIRVERAAV